MLPLTGVFKNYHWGRTDSDSTLAAIINSGSWKKYTKDTTSVDKNKPLAELWLGTHPSGMSQIVVGDQTMDLITFLRSDPSLCGDVDYFMRYGPSLPYLFKILSVDQALSLQVHPDKDLAKSLHSEDPEHYPDPNHKPEMAIAISDFEMLCDVRQYNEIENFIKTIGPLQNVIGEMNLTRLEAANDEKSRKNALAMCFANMLKRPRDYVSTQLKDLMTDQWLEKLPKETAHVLRQLYALYPNDPGCFCVFFLNYIRLRPGQAVFLQPMKLHAYIKGECIECMACSDNVVRAGLTNKYCDIETLTTMLDFEQTKPEQLIMSFSESKLPGIITYAPPVDEFKVDKIIVTDPKYGEFELPSKASASILIVLEGSAKVNDFVDPCKRHKLELGFTGFIAPQLPVRLLEIEKTFIAFRAYC